MNKLSEAFKVVSQIDPIAVVPGTVTGDVVDLQDFDRVAYVLQVGSIPASGTITYGITTSTTSNGTYVALSGGSIAALADTADNTQYVIEVDVATVKALGHRYLKDSLVVTTSTIACATVAIAHAARYSDEADLASVTSITAV